MAMLSWQHEAASQPQAVATDAAPLEDCEIVARVNNEVILACELSWQTNLMLRQRLGKQALDEGQGIINQIRRAQLEQLTYREIELVLLYSDFLSNAPGADMNSIHEALAAGFEDSEVPRLMKVVGVEDRKELEKVLREVGTSLGERREAFFRTVINQSITFDKEVTHEQMLEYYQAHLDEYEKPHRVRWEEILVAFSKHPSKQAAYAALAQLGNQAHATAASAAADQPAFEEIAKASSDGFTADEGGQHDWTSKGALTSQSIDEALFTLPVGQMSPILEGATGFHIVRVLERREAGPLPFREVQAAISKGLHDERFTAAVNAKLDELKRNAHLWTVFTGDLSAKRLAELEKEQLLK